MNRRKFIKTGLQTGGVGLMVSTLGCQGSFFDAFESSAEEAIVAQSAGTNLYKVNLVTGATSVITSAFAANLNGVALKDQDTALVIDNTGNIIFYEVNLNTGNVKTHTTNITTAIATSIGIENESSILVGDSVAILTRINLNTLANSVLVSTGGAGSIIGIAIESSSSALILDSSVPSLIRVNLLNGTSTTLASPAGNQKIAYAPSRNLALISNSAAAQINRFDLSSNSSLSGIGPANSGPGIALENSHSVLVADNSLGGLYRVDLDTGVISRVDDNTLLNGVSLADIAVRFR